MTTTSAAPAACPPVPAPAATAAPAEDPLPPQRGHHLELHLQVGSGEPPAAKRKREAERLQAAGVPGTIRVYSLNLLWLRFAAVQAKGTLSWKLRETAEGPDSDTGMGASRDVGGIHHRMGPEDGQQQ